MAWRALQSRNLLGRDYDPATGVLAIQFSNLAVYQYAGVPQTVVDSLDQSVSPKSFFDSKIKNVYNYRKVMDSQRGGARMRGMR